MNEDVRNYFINIAKKKDQFVYYSDLVKDCNLGFDLSTKYGQKQLGDVLGEVSEFEDSQGRPLLSALAIYKDKKKNDHGFGFYKLAQYLKKGSAKKLREDLFGFAEAERCRVFWQDEDNISKFGSIEKTLEHSIVDLFQRLMEESEYAEDWKHGYLHFVKNVKKLRFGIEKNGALEIDDEVLYSSLHSQFNSYAKFMKYWLKVKDNRISSRGQSVLSGDNFETLINDEFFKLFAKKIILTPTQSIYDSFRGWWYGNKAINNKPLLINRAFAAVNPELLSSTVHEPKFWDVLNVLESSYGFKVLKGSKYNWFASNVELTNWLDDQLGEILTENYGNEIDQIITRNIFVWLIYEEYAQNSNTPPNLLIKRDRPDDGFESIPESNKTFKGVDIDYEERAKNQKDLGDAGEELVKRFEKKILQDRGLLQESQQVKIAQDGDGYDVYSFDELGNEKYIEVKTTSGKAIAPFYLSENEIDFMRLNQANYCIYRVYNFDEENNSGEFFELNGDIENQVLMKAIQFKVFVLKK